MHLTNLDESRWFDTNFQKLTKGNQYKKLRIVNSLILIMRLNDPNKDNNQNEVTFLCTIRYLLLRKKSNLKYWWWPGRDKWYTTRYYGTGATKISLQNLILLVSKQNIQINTYMQNSHLTHIHTCLGPKVCSVEQKTFFFTWRSIYKFKMQRWAIS